MERLIHRTRRFGAWLCLLLIVAGPVWAQNPNVTVNDQPSAEQRLAEVNALRQAGRYDAAAELIQELVAGAGFKLVTIGEGRYTDASQWAREELLRDAALQGAYRQRYAVVAAREVRLAEEDDAPMPRLRAAYEHYMVTSAGLEAGLTLAGRLLESGQASAADTLLGELLRHPDREDAAPRLMALRGAAAVYLGDTQLAEDLALRLAQSGAQAQAEWLASLSKALKDDAVGSEQALVDAGEKPEELRHALWDQPLAEAEQASQWSRADRVLPVVTQTRALVNNGRQVAVLERASGQRLWVYPPDDSSAVNSQVRRTQWRDIRGVGLGEGVVFAVIGDCNGINETRNPEVPPNKLVCLDESTGGLLWERSSGEVRLNEPTLAGGVRIGRANLQHTHFVGTPILAHGQVLVLLRRGNSQGSTQATWLMSFDADDGTLRWYRHLALVSLAFRSDATQVSPQLTRVGETVYFSDGIATVAAIDARRGSYRWLHVLPVGSGIANSLQVATEGYVAPPVMTRAGLLVPLALTGERLVLLDPADGTMLRSFEREPQLRGVQYLMPTAGEGAVVVSLSSVVFWDADRLEVAWRFALADDEQPTGLGDVSERFIVVPTNNRLVVLDRATGRLLDEGAAVEGNVLIENGETLATSNERVYSYTSWDRAYERLVQRIMAHPDDPDAGLALASLALRHGGRDDAVTRGIDFALAAIERQPAQHVAVTRQRVFDQLRSMVLASSFAEPRVLEQIYDRLALVAYTVEQEAAYHLDAARYHARQGHPERAVDHFQAVVAEPAFASQSYRDDATTSSAGAVAHRGLVQLIERHGRTIYGRYDALAHAALSATRSDESADPLQFAVIAQRFPVSSAAVEALLEAGRSAENLGMQVTAGAMYQQAIVRAASRQQQQATVGQLLTYYLGDGRTDDASALLDRVRRQSPDLYPLYQGQPIAPAQWAGLIAETKPEPVQATPLADDFGQPIFLSGALVPSAHHHSPHAHPIHLYLAEPDGVLACYAADDLDSPRWRTALPLSGAYQLIVEGDEQVLLWSNTHHAVVALNAASGSILWMTDSGIASAEDRRVQRQVQTRRAGGSPTLFAVTDAVVCVGDRASARVLAIDRASGRVLWRTALGMSELTAIAVDNWALAAVGPVGRVQELSQGRLALLGLFTGERITETPEIALGVSPLGLWLDAEQMVVVGPTGVVGIDRGTGGRAWVRPFVDVNLSGGFAVANDLLAVEDSAGMVHVLDIGKAGADIGQVIVRGRSDPIDLSLVGDGDSVWVRRSRGITRLGRSPVIVWRDAVSLESLRAYRVLIGDERVAMLAAVDGQADPDVVAQPGRAVSYNLFVFDKAGGILLSRHIIGPVIGPMNPRKAAAFGGGIAIPVGPRTLVVPAANPQQVD